MMLSGSNSLRAKERWEKKRAPKGRSSSAGIGDDKRTPLCCARCGASITDHSESIEIDGLHRHSQVNPHGYIWSFRCFANAWGLSAQGPASREFSWFQGTTWQIECCSGCAMHLGWRFESETRIFFGLIDERLIECRS
jgi:hypothetical protein